MTSNTVYPSQTMRYVAAYLLASLGQEGAPSKEKITSILDSVGIDVDNEKLGKVCHPAISILQLLFCILYR